MRQLKKLSIALALAGLVLGTLLVGVYGFGRIANAILSVGVRGFVLFCVWQLLVIGILGIAWRVIAPVTQMRLLAIFVWGRMVRDSAASCLPFSQLGGFVLGARAVTLHGISLSVATISTVVDITAEFATEILFAAGGLLILVIRPPNAAIVLPAEIGLALAFVSAAAVLWLQRGVAPILMRLSRRILGRWVNDGSADAPASEAELAAMYGHTGRLASGAALHLLGWIGKGVGNWIAFRLLGSHISLAGAMAIEGLLHVMLAAAILVPASAGVQEAGYVVLGTLFGVPPEVSLGASLIRRARDIAIGIPILLIWQIFEARRLTVAAPLTGPRA
ncbi:MAG TPA: lysylphosphatidylglycerol synthase domain-containing protein [Rhizomicrobium sp.]|nr:lysylphosphatidylglycerol synthase domain-containing protein [Rhizomicrobium sp.]